VNDEFKFLCFKLSTAHISTINNIFLEEAYHTSSIVYHSRTALQAAINKYLVDERPGLKQAIDIPGVKDVLGIPEHSRCRYMRTLEQILRHLGGSTTYKIKSFGLVDAQGRIHMALKVGRLVGFQILHSQQPPESLPRDYILLKPGAYPYMHTKLGP
jgi:hypothetical protein